MNGCGLVGVLIWIAVILLAAMMLACVIYLFINPKGGRDPGIDVVRDPIVPQAPPGLAKPIHHPSEHGVYSYLDDKEIERVMNEWTKEPANA